jgi:hypothetical protein
MHCVDAAEQPKLEPSLPDIREKLHPPVQLFFFHSELSWM